MGIPAARPLHLPGLAYQFLSGALGYPEDQATADLSMRVCEAEKLVAAVLGKDTLSSTDNRNPKFVSDNERKLLREKVFSELIGMNRLENDDEIAMGKGGIMPASLKSDRQAFIVIGPPASGKSSLVSRISDEYGATVIDSDFAKRKLPEFGVIFGADVVHQESSLIAFGSENGSHKDEPNLVEYCVGHGHNVVIPKIGHKLASIRELRDSLRNSGYKVHLTLVSLDRRVATKRALERFMKTERYVPLALIFDSYANDPILSYYRIRGDAEWTSYGKVSTVEPSPARFVEGVEGNPARLFQS